MKNEKELQSILDELNITESNYLKVREWITELDELIYDVSYSICGFYDLCSSKVLQDLIYEHDGSDCLNLFTESNYEYTLSEVVDEYGIEIVTKYLHKILFYVNNGMTPKELYDKLVEEFENADKTEYTKWINLLQEDN